MTKKTVHGAQNKSDCAKMAKKYGWQLESAKKTNRKELPIDCEFIGDAEFPKTGDQNDE